MTEKKENLLLITGIFAAGFCFCAAVFAWGYGWSGRMFYDKMAAVAAAVPDRQEIIMQALKETQPRNLAAGREILERYGYYGTLPGQTPALLFFAVSFLMAGGCTAVLFFFMHRSKNRLRRRCGELTEYLREVEDGNYHTVLTGRQDVFSNLEDEIYKTVLALREGRERAAKEKETLARNLADISHQFKTPLTSLSVLGELLQRRISREEEAGTFRETEKAAGRVQKAENIEIVRKMERQTERLVDLSAALLTLSRADAGVLTFEMREVPVKELLECALEPVLPLLDKKKQKVIIMEEGEVLEELCVFCDLGWMREALGNLLKNASEHAPEGSRISLRAWDNPVFTAVAVEDEGKGFSKKDLPHLFERFYRGEDADKDSVGIGLSLSRTLIEAQGGEIRAENRREGGARFLIKFYKKR